MCVGGVPYILYITYVSQHCKATKKRDDAIKWVNVYHPQYFSQLMYTLHIYFAQGIYMGLLAFV